MNKHDTLQLMFCSVQAQSWLPVARGIMLLALAKLASVCKHVIHGIIHGRPDKTSHLQRADIQCTPAT